MKSKSWLVLLTLSAVTIIVLAGCGPGGSGSQSGPAVEPKVGYTAPDFSLKDLQGNEVQLSDLRGQPVVVNFLHTWCVPCNESAPHFQTAVEKYQDQGLVVVSIDSDDPEEDIKAFIDRHGVTYPIVVDRSGNSFQKYEVRTMPTTYFVGPDGVIRDIRPGTITLSWFDQNMAALN